MKLMTGILAVGVMTGGAWAQNPNIITNVQSTMQGVQQKKTNDSNAALGLTAAPANQPAAAMQAGAPAKKAPSAVKAGVPKHPAPAARPVIAAKEAAPKASVKAVAVAQAEASKATAAPKPEEKKWSMTGKRDPFFSPIVQAGSGSGCSTGKKCLEIGQIYVRGVVKSDNGFIAVVTNNMNKAYFLRENDPVFNGYVVKITGDTVVFQETVQDKLGKPEIREVTKRITTPAV
jgi:nucleoid-associated protein YgaU